MTGGELTILEDLVLVAPRSSVLLGPLLVALLVLLTSLVLLLSLELATALELVVSLLEDWASGVGSGGRARRPLRPRKVLRKLWYLTYDKTT